MSEGDSLLGVPVQRHDVSKQGNGGKTTLRQEILPAIGFAAAVVLAISLSVGLVLTPSSSISAEQFAAAFPSTQLAATLQVLLNKTDRSVTSGNYELAVKALNASVEAVTAPTRRHGHASRLPKLLNWRQSFITPYWLQDSNATLQLQLDTGNVVDVAATEFKALRYSGSGIVTAAPVRAFDTSSCSESAFSGFAGGVAVLELVATSEQVCSLYTQVIAAEQAGIVGVLVWSSAGSVPWPRVRENDWTPAQPFVKVPAFGVSAWVSDLVLTMQDTPTTASGLSMAVTCSSKTREVDNLVYGIEGKDTAKAVLVGAHLDSVLNAPGANDNGSGAATVFTLLAMTYALYIPHYTVLFAFWGAEEEGLIGSRYFVSQLDEADNAFQSYSIIATLNFDMLASPNNINIAYYNLTNMSDTQQYLVNATGHAFQALDLNYTSEPFSTVGGSDYFAFLRQGIPTASIATGAGGLKTTAEQHLFGGLVGVPYDPCYHKQCDDMLNYNETVHILMSKVAAHLFWHVAGSDCLETFRTNTSCVMPPPS
eukprot:m.198364 g.198364  ORF g.198364 m.198364 type:complete len:538 (+) comp14921_c2_seq2:369-1982(+)